MAGSVHPHLQHASRTVVSREIISSTTLQQLLYFHAYFSVTWTCLFAFTFRVKYLNFDNIRVSIFTPILYGLFVLTEIGRLYCGYHGNLHELTSELASFLFLTIFPQLFICVYMLFIQDPLLQLDVILGYIQLVLLILELFFSYNTINNIIQAKTARFQVEFASDFDNNNNRNEGLYEEDNIDNNNKVQDVKDDDLLYDNNDTTLIDDKDTNTNDDEGLISKTPKSRAKKKKSNNPFRLNQNAQPAIELTTTQPLPILNNNNTNPPPVEDNYNDPYRRYSSTKPSGLRGTSAPGIDTVSARNYNTQSISPQTPTAATFGPGNESEEEKIRRRMLDRAIIRGEFDRRKSGSRPTTAASGRQIADTANNNTYTTTSIDPNNPYTGRDGIAKKPLTAEQILAESQSRRASAQVRRDYVEQVDRKYSNISTTETNVNTNIPLLSTTRPTNIELYERILGRSPTNTSNTTGAIIPDNPRFNNNNTNTTDDTDIDASVGANLVSNRQTVDFTTNVGRDNNSNRRLLTGLNRNNTNTPAADDQQQLLAKKRE